MTQYIGELRVIAATYAPKYWMLCNGQSLLIDDYPALYSLLGTTYGGDGETHFNLPDFRGRIPLGVGDGPALTPRELGDTGGQNEVALSIAEMAAHNHVFRVTNATANSKTPIGTIPAKTDTTVSPYYKGTGLFGFSDKAVATAGEGKSHENVMPQLCINYIISIAGEYPSPT